MASRYNPIAGTNLTDADSTVDPSADFSNEYVAVASSLSAARIKTFDAASAETKTVIRIIAESQAPGGDLIIKNTAGTTLYTFAAGFGGTRAISIHATGGLYQLLSIYYVGVIDSATTSLAGLLSAADKVRVNDAFLQLAGRAGGQTASGGTAASENLTLSSTAHGTKGHVRFGSATNYWDEVNSKFVHGAATVFDLARTGDQQFDKTGSGDFIFIADGGGQSFRFVGSGGYSLILGDSSVEVPSLGTPGGFVKAAASSGALTSYAYYTAKRGTALTNADQTLQPFTDKSSEYLQSTTLTANRVKTLGTTTVVNGTVVRIIRTESAAFTLAVVNGGVGGGTLHTFAASPTEVQAATFYYNGVDWVLSGFEYLVS